MVWGDGGAYATWFSADPEKIQGINMLPITGGHLYLGYHPAYIKINYDEMVRNSGGEPTVWQDILWQFLALGDPDRGAGASSGRNPASPRRRARPGRTPSTGSATSPRSGTVDTAVTADNPLAAVFSKNGARTYVAATSPPRR